jgi:4-phytase/acid phosphatase
MRLLLLALSAMMLTAIATAQEKKIVSGDYELVYALYVVRHGVRSPTSDIAQYHRFSSATWPEWSVPPGDLTTHGYQVIKELGAYDREELATQGLLAPAGCSDVDRVFIHSDSDQRTRETSKALAEGMFPGCKVVVDTLEEGASDPLFHLRAAGVSPKKANAAAIAVLDRVGNDPKSVAAAYQTELTYLDQVLAKCGTSISVGARTSIFDVPASVDPGTDDHLVTMRGPINTAGTLTENMLLEYAEGMPDKDVGWGCINGVKLRKLIDLHTRAADLTQRTPAVAVPQAAALLRSIDRSIMQAVTGREVPGAEGKPGDKLLLLVGHDTNLNNLAGALGLHWFLDGRKDDTPPGSGLVFELWKSRSLKTYSVRMFFTTQTLEQMRNATPLTRGNPPLKVSVSLPTCGRTRFGCDIMSFEDAMKRAAADGDHLRLPGSSSRDDESLGHR